MLRRKFSVIFLNFNFHFFQFFLSQQKDIPDNVVTGFQIAFDLYESASQQFLRRIMEAIASILPSPPPSPDTSAATAANTTSTPAATDKQQQSELRVKKFPPFVIFLKFGHKNIWVG